jgi:hypothetical protein
MLKVADRNEAFRDLRHGFGHTLLLALDLLVAADIILTITIDLSFQTLGILGLLVLIRTFCTLFGTGSLGPLALAGLASGLERAGGASRTFGFRIDSGAF